MRRTIAFFLTMILCAAMICTGAAGETLTIPPNVTEIGEEAFRGDTSLDEVILPEGLTTIGAYAFAESSVRLLYLPASLRSIDPTAFENCSRLLCYGPTGTYAHRFCKTYGINFDNPNAKLRALLIGETEYTVRLNGPDNDVACMEAVLRGMNWNVTKKLNATHADIYDLIDSTFSAAASDDISLFYYSGHGVVGSTEYYSGALATVDSGYISTMDLADILATIPGRVIVILDSCGSGAAVYDAGEDGLQPRGTAGFDPQRFNNGVINAFRRHDSYLQTETGMENGEPEDGSELTGRTGELREKKFYVVTGSAYEETSATLMIDDVWGGALTRGAAAALGCGFPDGSYGGSMPADGNEDGKLSFSEFAGYCRSYAQDYQNVQTYSAHPAVTVFARPVSE